MKTLQKKMLNIKNHDKQAKIQLCIALVPCTGLLGEGAMTGKKRDTHTQRRHTPPKSRALSSSKPGRATMKNY